MTMRQKNITEPTLQQKKKLQEAMGLHQSGQLDLAAKRYEKLLKKLPDNTSLLTNLGTIALQKGKLEYGVRMIGQSLQINPNQANALNNRGNALQQLKRLDEALDNYDRAIALKPDLADAYSNRGNTLKELSRFKEALASFDRAIALRPGYVNALNNRGTVLQDLNRQEDALASFKHAIALDPKHFDAHSNQGNALHELKRLNEALVSYDLAIVLKPDFAKAYSNRGTTLIGLKQFNEAINSYDHAIALESDYADAYFNRGNAQLELKRLDEAVVNFERAIALNPKIDFIYGTYLHTKMHLCIWNDLPQLMSELTHKINNNEKAAPSFAMLSLIDAPDIHRKTTEIYIKEKYPVNDTLPKIARYPKHSKVKIGYFSADFRNHPVSNLTAELYEIHDRKKFEIYAFSLGLDTKDDMNLRIKAGVDHFYDVSKMPDKDVAMLARSVELDIAVDLTGLTYNSRTGIFAMKAAPIQVNYLGYPGTLAANYIDYIIADPILIPADKQCYYSEKIACLPNSFMVNDTKIKTSKRVFTRAETGLPIDGFVFCSFNNYYKITPSTFTGWMRILSQVDGSVLWLPEGDSIAVDNLKREAVKQGVDEKRLIFAPRLALMEDHLNRIPLADLFLDTQPYNAHTTTSDALRMGLPVLTCMGNSFASRVAASLLQAVNLPELVTTSQAKYESLAIELAINPEKLKNIRNKLVSNLPTAPLFDTPLFTQHIESAYLTMYEKYQQGSEPDHIYVEQ
jgi:predicted O-linked N-acetylglucosamine transferase (SPINDLY family)